MKRRPGDYAMGLTLAQLTSAIRSKVEVHTNVVKDKGDSWLGCLGRVSVNPPEVDLGLLGDGYHNLNKDPQGPWLCTMKPDKLKFGPAAFPLVGYGCLVFPVSQDMKFVIHPAATIVKNGISLQDTMKFAITEEGFKALQESYYIEAQPGDMIFVPFGMRAFAGV